MVSARLGSKGQTGQPYRYTRHVWTANTSFLFTNTNLARGLMDTTCRVRLSVILTSVMLDLYSIITKSTSKPNGSESIIVVA